MVQQQRRRIILIAAGLGLVTFVVVFAWLSQRGGQGQAPTAMPGAAQASTPEKVTVVVATEDIPVRTTLESWMLDTMVVSVRERPKEALTSLEETTGRVTTEPLKQGQVLTGDLVVEEGFRRGLAFIIPEEHRAITLAVNDITGVGGFVKPGDHVDVLGTREVEGGIVTETVLQDVKVLATGVEVVPGKKPEDPPQSVAHVTLAVSPRAAQELALTERYGGYKLTLRPSGEHWWVQTPVMRRITVGQSRQAPARQPAPAAPQPAPVAAATAPALVMPTVVTTAGLEVGEASAVSAAPVELLGCVVGEDRQVALVRDHGRLFILAVGDFLTTDELVSEIGPGYIVLSGAEGDRVIHVGRSLNGDD